MQEKKKLKFYQRKYLINKRFQLKYTLLVILVCSAIYLLMGYYFYKSSLDVTSLLEVKSFELKGMIEEEDNYILYYLLAFFIVQVGSLLILGTMITHKLAGPVYRINGIIRELSLGKIVKVGNLRKWDEFKEFIEPLNDLTVYLRKNISEDVKDINVIYEKLEMQMNSLESESELKMKLQDVLGKLKELKVRKETIIEASGL